MFKAKKLTRNFAQGSLFRPLGHSRQFFVGALTTSGILGVIAFGLMTKSSLEVHVMPEKATDTVDVKTPQAQASSQAVADTSSASAPAKSSQPTTSQPIPAQTSSVTKSTPVAVQPQQKPVAVQEAKQAAQALAPVPKNDTAASVDLSTLGVRAVTGVNIPL